MSSLSKPRWAFAFAALVIGTAYSASLLGWRSLDVTNLDWLHGDPQQSYLGWAFMRAEQGWSWPPTWIDRLNYPFGLSAAYTDAIPLAALLFKPLAAFLPDPFQYSGIWLALCCGLQTWAGFLLARSVGAKDALQVFLVGLLFLLAPVFTWRLHGHFALSAHWLLLFSFYLYLSPPTHLTKWLALILTASLINPYLTVMAVMIFAAFLLKRRLIENVAWTKLAGASAAGIGVLAFGWLLAGFVVLGRAPSFQGPGFGYYSANLLALIDAGDQGAMLGYSFTKGPGQYEGNGYLGVGVAVLICAALLGVRKVSWRKDRYSFGPLAFWVFLAFLVALSFKIMLGAIVVYDYGGKLPQALISAWSAFRASGRFIWLLHYAILITSLVLLFRASRPKFATFLLALAVALQVYDLTPLRESVRSIVAMPGQTQLSDGVWMGLGEDHKHLVALPAWQCGPSKGPLGGNDFWALGLLVLREGMTLNSHYAARVTPEGQRYNCGDLVKRVVEGERLADTAYVFSLPMVRTLIAREMTSGCRLVDGVALCAPGLPELPPASGWPSVIAPYQLGSRIDLSNAGGADPYLGAGWSERSEAAKGLTTIGHLASLVLRLIEPLPDEAELVVEFGGAGAPPNAAFPLKVRVNGREVASMLLPIGVELQPLRLTLPSDLAATAGLLEIEFLVELPPVGEDEPQWPYHSLEVRALEIR